MKKEYFKTMHLVVAFLLTICVLPITYAQVGIGNTNPNTNALLDIGTDSSSAGVRLPRVALSATNNFAPLSAHVAGMLVYNTATAGTGITAVSPGFYYNDGSSWVRLANNDDWKLLGNAGTNPATNFLGTTNAVDLVFRTNNLERIRTLSDGRVSINNATPGATDRFSVTGATNDDAINGYASGTGWGVYGTGATGVVGTGTNGMIGTGTNGVIGTGTNGVIGTGTAVGVYGEVSTATGFGVNAFNSHTSGTGLIAAGNNLTGSYLTAGTGVAATGDTGVFGLGRDGASPDTATGVIGVGNNNTTNILVRPNGSGGAFSGTTTGVVGYGTNTGTAVYGVMGQYTGGVADGIGVYGFSYPLSGSFWGIGVEGYGGWFGVHGIDASGFGYGVFSTGDFGSSGIKYFVIDHPADPENKYLRHMNIESNEILNLYRGIAVFDAAGNATVTLPDYYNLINKNASYQLTPIGASMPNIYISKEVDANGVFTISGGIAGKKVSWMLTAERNDPYLQQYPQKREVVVDKGERKGKYLMPQLYGQPKEKGMNYQPTPKSKKLQSVNDEERKNNYNEILGKIKKKSSPEK